MIKMTKSKILIVVMTVVMVLSVLVGGVSAKQENYESFDIVKAKHKLMEDVEKKINSKTIKKKSTEELNKLLATIASGENLNEADSISQLEGYGVFKLDVPENYNFNIMSVDNSDITMTNPSIYYDYNTSEWVITGGGYWKNDNWLEHVPNKWCTSGANTSCNVGGRDGFGVGFVNTGGNYTASVNSSYAYISDGEGRSSDTTVRSDGNGQMGFGFQLQDYLYKKCVCLIYLPADTSKFSYVGKHFAGLTRYSSSFADYNGNAVSYYTHTWNNTVLQSVSFGISGNSAGVSFTYQNQGNNFSGFSSDTSF